MNIANSRKMCTYFFVMATPNSTISTELNYKPVIYPYKMPNEKDILSKLMQVQDYDMMVKYCNDDFIASWVEYEKGNYASSMIIARDAMDKLDVKPVKDDLRWRLVDPQNYYKQVKNFADANKNNEEYELLIIEIMCEMDTLIEATWNYKFSDFRQTRKRKEEN